MRTTFAIGDKVEVGIFERSADDLLVMVWYNARIVEIMYDDLEKDRRLYQCDYTRRNGKEETRCLSCQDYLRHIMTEDDVDELVSL